MTRINDVLNKYSKTAITNFFQIKASNPSQLSIEYSTDPVKTQFY